MVFSFKDLTDIGETLNLIKPLLSDFGGNISVISGLLSGLSTEEQILQMQTLHLTEAQIAQVLETNGLASSEIQAALARAGLSAVTGELNTKQVSSILLAHNLNATTVEEIVSTDGLTVAILKEKLAMAGLNAETQEAIISQLGLMKSSEKAQNYFTGLGNSLKSFGKNLLAFIKTPVGAFTTSATVIIGAVATVNKIIEENRKKVIENANKTIEVADESITKYDSEIAKLKDLQTQLADAKNDKSALNSIAATLNTTIGDTAGLLDGESQAWETANQKIRDRITLLEQEKEISLNNKISANRDKYNSAYLEHDSSIQNVMGYDTSNKTMTEIAKQYSQSLDEIKKYGNKSAFYRVTGDIIGGNIVTYDEFNSYFEEQYKTATEVFTDYLKDVDTGSLGDAFKENILRSLVFSGENLDEIQADMADIFKQVDPINAAIEEYYNSLSDPNTDTEALYNGIKAQFDVLEQNFPFLSSYFDTYLPSLFDILQGNIDVKSSGGFVNTVKSIEELNESFSVLKETYDSTFSNQSTMQSAFDKIVKGTSLTSDEVLKLKELCPELTNEFSQTADGWIIDANKIKTANANLVQSTKDDIRKQIADYQAIIDEWDNISDYREKRSRYDEFAEAQQQIDELNLVLKMFSITLSDTDEQANVTLSDLKSAFDLLKDATDEFNTNGHLTVSTLKSIVSQYPDMQDAVDKFAGGLITEEQLLAELTTYYNQDLENYKTYLFDKFAATDSVTWGKYIQDNKDYIENFKEIYKIDLANCSTYADAKQKILDALVHIPDTTAYRETVKNILGNMQASYQQFYGDLNGFGSVEDILNTPDTSSKTSLPEEYQTALAKLEHEHNLELKSDKEYYIEKYQLAKDYLQGHDEYLSEWQSAEESCYKELKQLYQDAIDEQVSNYEDLFDVLKNINEEKIKALEDEKSALQDNADEQDRILKIQEAQLALDKAKKQTTWVLTEQGLKQVTDEKAVKEAQTTLDDALRESEIAELDKKIKALEDENSGYDQYKTDWENQQKKNNLVNVVGLSEDELQNITNENIKRIAEKYTDTLTAQSKLSSAETLGKTLNIDDLFKMFGSPYTADEAFAKLKEAGYSTFTNSSTDMNKLNQAVNSVTNNKNSNVGDINIVINDATDPQKVGEVVIEKLTNIYTYLNNKS